MSRFRHLADTACALHMSAFGGKADIAELARVKAGLQRAKAEWMSATRSAATTNPATRSERGCSRAAGRAETCARRLSATGPSRSLCSRARPSGRPPAVRPVLPAGAVPHLGLVPLECWALMGHGTMQLPLQACA